MFDFLFWKKKASTKEQIIQQYNEYVHSKLNSLEKVNLYDLFRGPATHEVIAYFNSVKSTDTFEIEIDDYAVVVEVKTHSENTFVFLVIYDSVWNEHIGFFHKTTSTPTFAMFKEQLEDVLAKFSDSNE